MLDRELMIVTVHQNFAHKGQERRVDLDVGNTRIVSG